MRETPLLGSSENTLNTKICRFVTDDTRVIPVIIRALEYIKNEMKNDY